MRETFTDARKTLMERNGINLEPFSFAAVIWYISITAIFQTVAQETYSSMASSNKVLHTVVMMTSKNSEFSSFGLSEAWPSSYAETRQTGTACHAFSEYDHQTDIQWLKKIFSFSLDLLNCI